MKKRVLLVMIVCLSVSALAQRQSNIWYFGFNAGVDFNSGEPVPLFDGQINTVEGSSSIADINGDLMFYTEGVTVYNKQHDIMENGEGLLGHYSSSQSALIVKSPGVANKYYIFTVGSQNSAGLNYSVVDMNANQGLGEVTSEKNVPLVDVTTEAIAGVLHSNGEDVWIVVRGYPGNTMYSYLVTASGISEPNISSVGPELGLDEFSYDIFGCMKISPDGSKLALASMGFGALIFDFDDSSGNISNPLQIDQGSNFYGPFGIEFSASSSVLYLTRASGIKQFNLTATDIPGSGIHVLNQDKGFTALQLASDNKIYCTNPYTSTLTVINNPEILGDGCNVDIEGVFLGNDNYSTVGLPTAISSYFLKPKFEITGGCVNSSISFTFEWNQIPDSILWDFGDGTISDELNPEHYYTQTGNYTVRLEIEKAVTVYEVIKEVTIYEPPQFSVQEDFYVCVPESVQINIEPMNFDVQEAEYVWEFEGELLENNTSYLNVNDFGTYKVTVLYHGCEASATITVHNNLSPINMEIIQFCDDGVSKLSIISGQESLDNSTFSYNWIGPDNFLSTEKEVIIYTPGNYTATIIDQQGCDTEVSYYADSVNCFIQRGISPNDDGKNDFFDLTGFEVDSLSIFNRYGKEVYTMNNYTMQWYGQDTSGSLLADGTYYYAIKFKNQPVLTGWVYINKQE